MSDHDDRHEEEWPNDHEANDIMLAYAANEESNGSGAGCAGVVLILFITVIASLSSLF